MKKLVMAAILVLSALLVSLPAMADTPGQCGDNLFWEYRDETIYITGTGDMYDNYNGWSGYRYSSRFPVKHVNIAEGATSVGEYDFGYFNKLISVTLPNTLEVINDNAFNDCESLSDIVVPDNVWRIGYCAFSNCYKLTNVTLGAGLTSIENSAFSYTSIESLYIPKSLAMIDDSAFHDCKNIRLIQVDPANVVFCTDNGVLFNKDKSKLILYQSGMDKRDYAIPTTVNDISIYAFYYAKIGKLTIPSRDKYGYAYGISSSNNEINEEVYLDGIKRVYGKSDNVSLKKLTLPDTLISVDGFKGSGLESVIIPGNTTKIGENAFNVCRSLKTATIYSMNAEFGSGAFLGAPAGFMMYGYTGSTAEAYAAKYGITFSALPPVKMTNIELSDTELTLNEWDSHTLSAKLYPSNVTNRAVMWYSSNEKVATVNENGWILAIDAGIATITCSATDGSGVIASCKVTVKDPNKKDVPVKTIELNRKKASLKIGETLKLKATVKPKNATIKDVTWTSSDPVIAAVDANGSVKALAPGKATVTATAASGVAAKCVITVKSVKVKTVTLAKTAKITIGGGEGLGKTLQLTAKAKPKNAYDKKLVWKTSDANVATVDENGLVTSVGFGKCKITATAADGGKAKAVCVLTVEKVKATKITISGEKKMKAGDKQTLTATITPANAYDASVKWKSSDKKIATVDENGVVTAIKKGAVTITAIAKDGSKIKATFKIKVTK